MSKNPGFWQGRPLWWYLLLLIGVVVPGVTLVAVGVAAYLFGIGLIEEATYIIIRDYGIKMAIALGLLGGAIGRAGFFASR